MLLTFISMSIAFFVTAKFLPGFRVQGAAGAAISALVFGVLQFLLGWLIFGVLGVATLGLGFLLRPITQLVVSWLVLMLADMTTDQLTIADKGTAAIGAVAITVISNVISHLLEIAL